MNTDATQQPPPSLMPHLAVAGTLSSTASSDLSDSVAGFRARTCTLQDLQDLPVTLSRVAVSVIEGLEIKEREVFVEGELSSSLSRSGSSESFESLTSQDSGISEASSEGPELDVAVPPGSRIMHLPTWQDFIQSEPVGNLLANLIAGQLSEDEKLAVPVEGLETFCLQAMGDLQYMVELSQKILVNIQYLNLPETAVKAISSKLEEVQSPYKFLKEDIDECLKSFRKGRYAKVERTIQAFSMDHPEGKSRVVTTRTNYVDKLICCWIYVLRNQEEWRKAMPAPGEIIKGIELPDPMALPPESDSPIQRAEKLYADSEKMNALWRKLESRVKPASTLAAGRKITVRPPVVSASPVARLPDLIPAPYDDTAHIATFTLERYQLPVAFDFGKSVGGERSEQYSRWVLPRKVSHETRTEEVFETRDEALAALKEMEEAARQHPERFGSERRGHEKAIVEFTGKIITRPVNYFEYQPVAINALEKLVDIGKNNTRKVNGPAMFLKGDHFKKGRFSSRQKGHWNDMRKELAEKSCGLWSLRIPSLQETVDMICEERHRQEVSRLRKEKKKQEKSVMHQLELGLAKVKKSIRSPRRSPVPSRGASPVPERRVIHTQSNPELLASLPAMRPRLKQTLSHADLIQRLRREQQRLSEEPISVPDIVIDEGPQLAESTALQPPVIVQGTLSPIASDTGSLTPEDLPTPREGSDNSPVAPRDDMETPMMDVLEDPFSEAFRKAGQ